MSTAVFDTLRFSRGLREVGVPEQQADRQAELMAEAFSAFADKLVTKDYFSEVLEARLNQQSAELEQRIVEKMNLRFVEQDEKFDARFAEQDEKFDARFAEQDKKFDARCAAMDEKFTRCFAEMDEKFTARLAGSDEKAASRFDAIEARLADHDARFVKLDRTLLLHTWMLGLITLVLVVPQLQAWVA
ncbi:hypothetical protein [Pseudohaliea rubra]|uniref:DUF1640 domain-containing protein n=1 Tax=Pseudohaliea rubra DSM 19751 TaxID=1265313 RepID=A0A095VRT4_9GAMM|nr:hypothetical protein [Pseudohaliea rubra]KGE03808.1 hypothetical protein HRUBRA_01555 [Pseudohaliea rubra DSM 19751]